MKTINKYRIGFYMSCALDILITICVIFITYLIICINADLKDLNNRLSALSQQIEELDLVVTMPSIDIPRETTEEEVNETDEVEYPKLYTDEDTIALTKMLWGEARGVDVYKINGKCVSSKCQQAAVVWTVLNRYDAGLEDTITDVVTARKQFVGYQSTNPVDEELKGLVTDVLDRWNREKHGETDVGRVLPADYMWFHGDGQYNHFRNGFNSKVKWNWKLADPYV